MRVVGHAITPGTLVSRCRIFLSVLFVRFDGCHSYCCSWGKIFSCCSLNRNARNIGVKLYAGAFGAEGHALGRVHIRTREA